MEDSHQNIQCCVPSVDFYQGWLIEIVPVEQGFKSVCCSPQRHQVIDDSFYACDLEAMSAAKRSINHYYACHTITQLLRELYEAQQLNFEEWRMLQESVTQTIQFC